MTAVTTAAKHAEGAPAAALPYAPPDRLGSTTGQLVTVDLDQLGQMLRRLYPSGADLTYRPGWWDLQVRAAGVHVGAENFDQLAAAAVAALRGRVADVDPEGTSGDPLVWLVLTSPDPDLRAWLNIPAQ